MPREVHASSSSDPDTVTSLEEVVVTDQTRRLLHIGSGSDLTLDVDAMSRVMRAFGEADPLNYVKAVGGITAPSDYASGMAVQGAAYSQSVYKAGEATIFFPYHFGGIFSIFNPMHFPSVGIAKSNYGISAPSRLGAVIELQSRRRHPDRFRASVNVGMTASLARVRVPISNNFSFDLSGRISYLDQLYGPILDMDDQKINYAFGEAALTARWTPTASDCLKADLIYNDDWLKVFDRHYHLDTRLKWRNTAASLTWTHNGPITWKAWGTWSGFRNVLDAVMPTIGIEVPSSIFELKAGTEIDCHLPSGKGNIIAGFETAFYRALPQDVHQNHKSINAAEYRLYAAWRKELSHHFSLDAGLRLSFYSTKGYHVCTPAPTINVYYSKGSNRAAAHFSISPQYLHQTGFADVGLSSNFWFPASAKAPRELAAGFSLSYSRSFIEDALMLTIEPYYRRILHDPEYSGILLDLLEKDYELDSHLLNSNGFNTGFDISANLALGPVSALANYSLGFARRRFPTFPDRYLPAMSEGLHSFNTTLSYTLGEHWVFGASFMLASGRCYTPVKALYLLGDNLMMVLGDRNSARMPLYHRLDLSASYRFKTGGRFQLNHTIVLSLLNAYGHRNIELSTYRFSIDDGTFYRHNVASLYRFLPSLSYTIDF